MKKLFMIVLTMSLVLGLSSCGVKDKVGEKADELIDSAIDQAADQISEKTGIDIDQAADQISEETGIDIDQEAPDKTQDEEDSKKDFSDLNIRDDADIDMDLLEILLDDGMEPKDEPVYYHVKSSYREFPAGELIEGEMIIWQSDNKENYYFQSGDQKNFYTIPIMEDEEDDDDMMSGYDAEEILDDEGLSNILVLKYDNYNGEKAIYFETEDYDEDIGAKIITKSWISAKTNFPIHAEMYFEDGELMSEITFLEVYFDDSFMDELDPPEGYEW